MHSYCAFIDESGDEGFTFKDPPERASSEWFVLSAIVLRADTLPSCARSFKNVLGPIEARRRKPAHFVDLPHDARVAIVHAIASLPARTISICFNKKMLGVHSLGSDRRLYFYCTRYLLERISWLARDSHEDGRGDGRCKLVFAHCKRLSYELLYGYFAALQNQRNCVAWGHIDLHNIVVKAANDSIWLRAADSVASGISRGLELSQYGLTEDRFARLLKPTVYRRGGNYFSYGLKLFPTIPKLEPERDHRYGWLDLYRRNGATRGEEPGL